jgi:hypothetical protein
MNEVGGLEGELQEKEKGDRRQELGEAGLQMEWWSNGVME